MNACRSFFSPVTIVLLSSILIGACASSPLPTETADRLNRTVSGVAVLGVGVSNDVSAGVNRHQLGEDLVQQIQNLHNIPLLDSSRVRSIVGGERYRDMLRNYEKSGTISRYDRQILMAARLPAQFAVIARVVSNEVGEGEPVLQPLLGSRGELLADREQIVLSTIRQTRLSATLIDLRTGSDYWTEYFFAEPVVKSAHTRYTGSSFSGTLAARFANTIANGVSEPTSPSPPSMRLTMRSLLREVALNMPIQ